MTASTETLAAAKPSMSGSGSLGAPLQFKQASFPPHCVLTIWIVDQPELLAHALAWLYLCKYHHAARVTQALDPGRAALPGRTIENAIAALSVRIDDLDDALESPDEAKRKAAEATRDNRVELRDGLLFQHVSWIAASMRLPNAKATPPHVRQADKGFDGVLLEIHPTPTALSRIVLCEDKASINPRSLVTGSIWPEIKLIQAGAKDREIIAALTAILATMPEIDQESVIDATEWLGARQFRVALTAGDDQLKAGGYQHLFAGFDTVAGGAIETRMAEVMPMPQVRPYLANLARIMHKGGFEGWRV
jgi:hypothetical protein